MALRLASKALCSAGTKTTKASLIERLATPSAKHSATSAQGTNRLIVSPWAAHRTASKRFRAPAGLQSPHARVRFRAAEDLSGRYDHHRGGPQWPSALGEWRLCPRAVGRAGLANNSRPRG